MVVTDEDTGGTAKTTKRKSASTASRSTSKPRARTGSAKTSASKSGATKAGSAKTGASKTGAAKTGSAKAASTKAPETKAPETKTPETKTPETKTPATQAAAAKSAAKSAAPPTPEASVSDAPKTEPTKTDSPQPETPKAAAPMTDASKTETPKTDAPKTTPPQAAAASSGPTTGGGTGGSGSGGGGGSYPAPAVAPQPASGGLFSMPMVLSLAAIVIAILIPVINQKAYEPAIQPTDIAALETTQAELAASVAEIKASIDALSVQQDTLRSSISAVRIPAVMIAASDLRAAIESGEEFAEPLTLFEAIAGENEAVASVYELRPLALGGIPTVKELQAAFGNLSHEVVASYQTVASEGDLAKRVSETMANLTAATTRLRWRLDGTTPPEGDSPLAVMARAEIAAAKADFDAVVAEIETLPEDLKAIAAGWIEQVQAQKQATTAIEDLDLFMIETLASARK